jgi:2'-5' RNA ligase
VPLRLFVAVNLSPEIRERLAAAQEHLRRARADVSWVRPENMHVTLKFLGETAEERLDPLRLALGAVARAHAPFRLTVAGVGSFGGRVPRVVWVGVTDGAEPLTALARRVEAALDELGFAREKRGFTAHLTLGRVRSPKNVEGLAAGIREIQEERFGAVAAEAFELIRSELRPGGSVYTVLERFALATPEGQEERHAG